MKKLFVVIFLFAVAFLITEKARGAEAEIKQLRSVTLKEAGPGYSTTASFFQIKDSDGVICYSVVSNSPGTGRSIDGGYPMTSISCVNTKK